MGKNGHIQGILGRNTAKLACFSALFVTVGVRSGVGTPTAAIQKGEEGSAAAGGMAEGDAAGGRDSGGANCGGDEVYDKNGVSDGAVRTETDDQPGTACKDGAGAGMRSGIRVGAVAPLAGGSGDGT